VKKGELVTITVSVTNPGPATSGSDESQVEVFPLRGGSEHAAANPYESVTPSQGTCTITGEGVTWRRSVNGRRLTATVPASRIFSPRVGKGYKLTIHATRMGAHALKRTVTFELCG
jgi:hypothetical protein